jgi:nucleoside 2-deoxyribosyltransferase
MKITKAELVVLNMVREGKYITPREIENNAPSMMSAKTARGAVQALTTKGVIKINDKLKLAQAMKIIYLANPLGFSHSAKQFLIPKLVRALEKMHFIVWEPFTMNDEVLKTSSFSDFMIAQMCAKSVELCDGIFAVVNGVPPDEGVMIELGMAMAYQKEVFLFRDDLRVCGEGGMYPLNLMLFATLSEDKWSNNYYTRIAELSNPHKALARFAKCRY